MIVTIAAESDADIPGSCQFRKLRHALGTCEVRGYEAASGKARVAVALRGASQAPFAAVQYFGRLPVPQVSSACIQFFAKLSVFRQKRGLLDAGRSSARLAVRLRIVVLPESRFDLRKRRVSKRASFRLGAEMRRVSNNSSSCQPNRPIIREVAEKPSRTRIIGCRRV